MRRPSWPISVKQMVSKSDFVGWVSEKRVRNCERQIQNCEAQRDVPRFAQLRQSPVRQTQNREAQITLTQMRPSRNRDFGIEKYCPGEPINL